MKEKRSQCTRVRKGADEIRGTVSGVPWTWSYVVERNRALSARDVLSLRRDYAHGARHDERTNDNVMCIVTGYTVMDDRNQEQSYASVERPCHLRTVGGGGEGNVFAISTKGRVVCSLVGSSDKTRGKEDLRRRGIRTITTTLLCQSR